MQTTIDSGPGGSLPTREAAAASALESAFDIDIGEVELSELEQNRFMVVRVDERELQDPPTVVIERSEEGFIPTGVLC